MKNIKVYTTAVKIVSFFLIPLSIVGLGIKWVVPSLGSSDLYLSLSSIFAHALPDQVHSVAAMPLSHRILGMIVDGISNAFIIGALLIIISLMNLLGRGEFFSGSVATLFMRLSTIMFCWALYAPFNSMLLSVITTWHNPPGHRTLAVTLGSSDLINIFIFCFLMIVAAIMQKGSSLQHDQDLTV